MLLMATARHTHWTVLPAKQSCWGCRTRYSQVRLEPSCFSSMYTLYSGCSDTSLSCQLAGSSAASLASPSATFAASMGPAQHRFLLQHPHHMRTRVLQDSWLTAGTGMKWGDSHQD